MKDDEFETKDYMVAAAIWIVIMLIFAGEAACAPRCGGFDLILFAICGIGFFAPAWFGAFLLKVLTKRR